LELPITHQIKGKIETQYGDQDYPNVGVK